MRHPQIRAAVEAHGGTRITLVFQNPTPTDAFLYRPNACVNGCVENNVFVVHDSASPVAYVGPYAKRPAPRPEDYITMPPGSTRQEEVDLASAYAVLPGGRYVVRYEAFHVSPADPACLWEVSSDDVAVGGAR